MKMYLIIRLQDGRKLRLAVEPANEAAPAIIRNSDPHVLRRECLPILFDVVSIPENQLYDVPRLRGEARFIVWNRVSQKLMSPTICLLGYFQLVSIHIELWVWRWRWHVLSNVQPRRG